MKKRYIVLGVLVAACAAAYYFTPSLETIVKKVVHKYGSQITGTDVNLQGFKLALGSGEGTINEITVGNPKGYSAPNIFALGEIKVKVDMKSLTKDTIIIDQISIKKPIITYEMLSLTQNNIKELQNNIKKNTATTVATEKKEAAQATQSNATPAKKEVAAAGKKVIIKQLIVDEGELQAIAEINGKSNEMKVILPKITMQNIGGANNGADIATTISQILTTILNTASQTVVKGQLGDLKSLADDNLKNVVGGVKDRVKELGIFKK